MSKRVALTAVPPRLRNHAGGYPTKYEPKLFPKTAQFLASRGAIQSEIADCLGVSTRTLRNWCNEYPEMAAALDAGNDVFNPRVERSLAEQAIGFFVEEEEVVIVGSQENRIAQKITVRKYVKPNVTAAIFFLKNRRPEQWRDVQEHHHSGELKSSSDLLQDIQAKLLSFQAAGYLELPTSSMKEINPRE